MPVLYSKLHVRRKFGLTEAPVRPAAVVANLTVHRSDGMTIATFSAGAEAAPLVACWANTEPEKWVFSPNVVLSVQSDSMQ